MSQANQNTARAVLASWAELASKIAPAFGLPADLMLALVCQESAGIPTAMRVERGFWSRYGAAMLAAAKRTLSQNDDRWMQYPDVAAASYGLCQVLYQVALERGFDLQYPTDLCDPTTGLRAGCAQLRFCAGHAANVNVASDAALVPILQRYNGGGNPTYAREVLAWRQMIKAELFDAYKDATERGG